MMRVSKAVLISIRPKWCEKIASGEKTIEVRRTRPKLEPPFKVYIYCTKAEERLITILKDGDENYGEIYHGKPVFIKTNKPDNLYAYGHSCAVIGEFTCDRIYELAPLNHAPDDVEQQSCLTREDIVQYLRGTGYGWHISDLRIYDTLRELSEFWLYNEGLHKRYDAGEDFCCYDASDENGEALTDCGEAYNDIRNCYRCWNEWSGWCRRLKRPPQSWCYVEECGHA